MSIFEKLAAVQQEVKAPKNLHNDFGDFYYRSAETILEAVKPILKKVGAYILLSDEIVEIGGRIYVRATAAFGDFEGAVPAVVTAFAREPDEKKKMDSAQITGTASSYARKYALNGLLLLDDTKDPDTNEYQRQNRKEEKLDNETIKLIVDLAKLANVDLGKALGGKDISSLSKKRADELIIALKDKVEKNGIQGEAG